MKSFADILDLTAPQRVQLVEAIWDSLVETPEAIPLTAEMREELDRRLDSYYGDRSSARPSDEITADLCGDK